MIYIFFVKRDCLLFSVNVKLFFEFFMMREKSNYFCVKVFSEEVQGILIFMLSFVGKVYEGVFRNAGHIQKIFDSQFEIHLKNNQSITNWLLFFRELRWTNFMKTMRVTPIFCIILQKKCIRKCMEKHKPSKSPPPPTEPGKVADEVSLVFFITF